MHFSVFEERGFSGNNVISSKYIISFNSALPTGNIGQVLFASEPTGNQLLVILEQAKFGIVYAS